MYGYGVGDGCAGHGVGVGVIANVPSLLSPPNNPIHQQTIQSRRV